MSLGFQLEHLPLDLITDLVQIWATSRCDGTAFNQMLPQGSLVKLNSIDINGKLSNDWYKS